MVCNCGHQKWFSLRWHSTLLVLWLSRCSGEDNVFSQRMLRPYGTSERCVPPLRMWSDEAGLKNSDLLSVWGGQTGTALIRQTRVLISGSTAVMKVFTFSVENYAMSTGDSRRHSTAWVRCSLDLRGLSLSNRSIEKHHALLKENIRWQKKYFVSDGKWCLADINSLLYSSFDFMSFRSKCSLDSSFFFYWKKIYKESDPMWL